MIFDKSIIELANDLRQKKLTIVDIVSECLVNIDKYNTRINALITVIDKEKILSLAKDLDKNLSKDKPLLYGMPYVLKDSYVTKNIRTTCSSNVLKNFVPQYNATVYQKLIDSGAILLGKANMDAWGHGNTTENTDFGVTKNPYDLSRVPGGSSGGCAAALASNMCVFAIGEDTGGSVRFPASWCNVTGLKVTYGRVSRYGCISYVSSFDTVCPMAKSSIDAAVVLEAIAGLDKYDNTSSKANLDLYVENINNDIKGIKIGFPKEMLKEGLDVEIKECILRSIEKLKQMGAVVNEISMPMLKYGLSIYYIIAPSETSSNLARYDGVRYGEKRDNFTDEAARRIMIGTYALSSGYYDAYYLKAQKAKVLLEKEYEKAFSKVDAIIMPVTPSLPTKIGELMVDPLKNYLADFYNCTQNPVGVPSIAIPCGFSKTHLPIGMQIVGNKFSEKILLNLANVYQNNTDYHKTVPSLIEK